MPSADPHRDVPLVAHLVYRFDCGGLQTLLSECIARMPSRQYRHAVICLTGQPTEAGRIRRADVAFHLLDKPPGIGMATHV
jgi:hypothetical protein